MTMTQTHDTPFKLPLKPMPYGGGIHDSNGNGVAFVYGIDVDIEDARIDYIVKCVNAHAGLVERVATLEDKCAGAIAAIRLNAPRHAGLMLAAALAPPQVKP